MKAPHLCLLGDANSVHVRRWAREFLARSYRVSIVTARPRPLAGVEQRVMRPVTKPGDWLWRVAEARRHVRELAPDLLHAHYVSSYGYLAARCPGRPRVMTAWGSDILVTPRASRWMRWLTGFTLRRADLITGDSADLLEEIGRYHPRAALRLIHWGADMATFRPARWDRKPGFAIVSLRSWEANYNIDVVVAALALLAERLPDAGVHLHLLGGGSQELELRAQVRALGLADHVTFHGRVADAAMLAALQAAKVSVSVPTSDATSVSVLESMACGVPVVASDLPANRHWLAADPGMLVAPRDPAMLAAALEALWRDDARAQQLGQRNHERMQDDGARSVQMDAMALLYEELMRAGVARART